MRGTVTYQIRLHHEGGSQPINAEIRDELPYPLHLRNRTDDNGNVILINVDGTVGGGTPFQARLTFDRNDPAGPANQVVHWKGTLAPDAEVILSFDVHVHPICPYNVDTITIRNIANARSQNGAPIESEVKFTSMSWLQRERYTNFV